MGPSDMYDTYAMNARLKKIDKENKLQWTIKKQGPFILKKLQKTPD